MYSGHIGTGTSFSPSTVSIVPEMHHIHVYLHTALTRRTNGRNLGTFEKRNALSEIGDQWIEKYFTFLRSSNGQLYVTSPYILLNRLPP
jgi:hypothetical protein